MKIVTAGSRNWRDGRTVRRALREAQKESKQRGERLVVIHGGYEGSDEIVDWTSNMIGAKVVRCQPNWLIDGADAGFISNAQMLDEEPERVIVFRSEGKSRIIEDLVARAERAGIEVDTIEESHDHVRQ